MPPRDASAAYVQHALEEFGGNLAELVRRVSAEVGRPEPYARNAGQGWLTKGNAPGEVLIALHRITGLSLDLYASMRERQPATVERIAALEAKVDRLVADLEQLRRETGRPYQIDEDVNEPDETAAHAK